MHTISVAWNAADFRSTTVVRFRGLLHEKWSHVSTGANDLRLLFAGKQLQDRLTNGKEATLGDYNIHRNSTIQIVFRLSTIEISPLSRKVRERVPEPPVVKKVHNLSDLSLIFTSTEEDAIMGYSDENDQPRIKMSCGHAVDANSLTDWCRSLIHKNKFEFYCPAIIDQAKNKECGKVWPYEEVRRAAHLTEAEQEYFETKMSEHASPQFCDMKKCPGCGSFVERLNLHSLQVRCSICTKKKGRNYDFCWNCNREWTGPDSSVKCGSDKCEHVDLPAIRDAPITTISGKQVPSCRACPTCGRVVEHKQTGCKFITCPRCRKAFCFLCLELENVCLNTAPCSWRKPCSKEPAKRQTHIPVWSQ